MKSFDPRSTSAQTSAMKTLKIAAFSLFIIASVAGVSAYTFTRQSPEQRRLSAGLDAWFVVSQSLDAERKAVDQESESLRRNPHLFKAVQVKVLADRCLHLAEAMKQHVETLDALKSAIQSLNSSRHRSAVNCALGAAISLAISLIAYFLTLIPIRIQIG